MKEVAFIYAVIKRHPYLPLMIEDREIAVQIPGMSHYTHPELKKIGKTTVKRSLEKVYSERLRFKRVQ